MGTHSRRTFLKGAVATAVGATAIRGRAWGGQSASIAIQPKLSQFGYADVQLLDGIMLQQFTQNHSFFLALNEDKLLKPFRLRAGMPAPGEDMGGWYDYDPTFNPHSNFHGFVPGHTFGQYVSALSRAYAITGDKATKAKVESLVRAYAGAVSEKFYVDYHLPAYTYDKVACGLIDAYQYAGDASALKVLDHATDAVLPFLPAKALSRKEQYALPHKDEAYCWDETYTLPENLFLAYRNGGVDRYRQLAVRFLEDDFYFNPLSEGENVLPGEHAYSHVNAFSSAMQAYLVLGSEKHLRAAQNGFDFVCKTQSFATGGWGPDETFRKPGSGEIGESLNKTHAGFETPCGAYGHFKIARYLLRTTGDSRYGDSMERVLYNTILGVKPILEDGSSFYYSDYNYSAHKGYHHDKWPCCSGTLPQIAADYGISSYFKSADGAYVNLYVPSRVTWKQGGAQVSVTQKTDYPYTAQTELHITASRAETFALYLRIPAWAGAKTAVSVNGKRAALELKPGSFVPLKREWKSGDRVEIEFDMSAQLEAVDPEHPSSVALVRGPLALFGVGEIPGKITKQELLAAEQIAKGSTEWQAKTSSGLLRMKSFSSIQDESYRLYQKLEV